MDDCRSALSTYTTKAFENMFIIASYPRSGNHIIRTVLEYTYKKPTKGCMRNPKDPPIYLRPKAQQAGLLEVHSHEPIGIKAHFTEELAEIYSRFSDLRMLLVHRCPVDALSSHIARELVGKNYIEKIFFNNSIEKYIQGEVGRYMGLMFFFKSFVSQDSFLINYEDLLGCEGEVFVNRLLQEIDAPRKSISKGEFKNILKISKENQSSLPSKIIKYKNYLSPIIRSNLKEVSTNIDLKITNVIGHQKQIIFPFD